MNFEVFCNETIISDEEWKQIEENGIPLYGKLFENIFNVKNELEYGKRIINY